MSLLRNMLIKHCCSIKDRKNSNKTLATMQNAETYLILIQCHCSVATHLPISGARLVHLMNNQVFSPILPTKARNKIPSRQLMSCSQITILLA